MLTSQTEDQSFSKCSVTKCLIKIVSLPYNSGILIYLVVILGQNDSKICICTAPVKINTHGYSKIWTNPSLQLSAFILFIIHKYSLNLKSSDALLSQGSNPQQQGGRRRWVQYTMATYFTNGYVHSGSISLCEITSSLVQQRR